MKWTIAQKNGFSWHVVASGSLRFGFFCISMNCQYFLGLSPLTYRARGVHGSLDVLHESTSKWFGTLSVRLFVVLLQFLCEMGCPRPGSLPAVADLPGGPCKTEEKSNLLPAQPTPEGVDVRRCGRAGPDAQPSEVRPLHGCVRSTSGHEHSELGAPSRRKRCRGAVNLLWLVMSL